MKHSKSYFKSTNEFLSFLGFSPEMEFESKDDLVVKGMDFCREVENYESQTFWGGSNAKNKYNQCPLIEGDGFILVFEPSLVQDWSSRNDTLYRQKPMGFWLDRKVAKVGEMKSAIFLSKEERWLPYENMVTATVALEAIAQGLTDHEIVPADEMAVLFCIPHKFERLSDKKAYLYHSKVRGEVENGAHLEMIAPGVFLQGEYLHDLSDLVKGIDLSSFEKSSDFSNDKHDLIMREFGYLAGHIAEKARSFEKDLAKETYGYELFEYQEGDAFMQALKAGKKERVNNRLWDYLWDEACGNQYIQLKGWREAIWEEFVARA